MATRPIPSVAITIRPVTPTDRLALARFYAELSDDSRCARFLGASRGLGEGAVATFCGADHAHREGLVAVARAADADETIVGHLCLEPADDETFEMAVAVADAWRRHGIARALLEAAIGWSRGHGIHRLRATMLATNGPVLGIVEATFDIDRGLAAAA